MPITDISSISNFPLNYDITLTMVLHQLCIDITIAILSSQPRNRQTPKYRSIHHQLNQQNAPRYTKCDRQLQTYLQHNQDILRQDKLMLRNLLKNNNDQSYYELINIFQECKKPLNKIYLYENDLKNLEIKLRKFITTSRKNHKENQIKKLKQTAGSIQCLSKAINRARSKQQSWNNNSSSSRKANYFRIQDDPYVATFGQHNLKEKLSTESRKSNRQSWTLRLNQTTNNQSTKLYLLNHKNQKNKSKNWILDSQNTSKNQSPYKYNNNLIRNQSHKKTHISQIKEDQIIEEVPSHRQIDNDNDAIKNFKEIQHHENYYNANDFLNPNEFKLFSPAFTKQQKFINQKPDLYIKDHIQSPPQIFKQISKQNQKNIQTKQQYQKKQKAIKTIYNDLLGPNQQFSSLDFISNRNSYQQSNIKIKTMLEESRKFIQEYQQQRNKTQKNNTEYKKQFKKYLQPQYQKEIHSAEYNNTKQPNRNLDNIARVVESLNHQQSILPTYLQFSGESEFQNSFVQHKISNDYYLKGHQDLFTPPQLLQQCKQFLKSKNKFLNLNSVPLVHTIDESEQHQSNIDNSLNYFHLFDKTEEKPTQRRYNKFSQNKQLGTQLISKQQTLCLTSKNTKDQYHLQSQIPKTKQQVLSYLFKQTQKSYLNSSVFLEKIKYLPQSLKNLLSSALINQRVQYLTIPNFLYTLPITNSLSRDLMTILDLDISHKSYIGSSNIKIFLQNISQAQIADYYQIESLLWKVFEKAQSYHMESNKMLTYWHLYYLQMRQDIDFIQLCRKLGQFQFQIQLEGLQVSQQ